MSQQPPAKPATPQQRGPLQYKFNASFPWLAVLACTALAVTPGIIVKKVTDDWHLVLLTTAPVVLLVFPVIALIIVKWRDRPLSQPAK